MHFDSVTQESASQSMLPTACAAIATESHLHVLLAVRWVSKGCLQVVQVWHLVHKACHELPDLNQACSRATAHV